MVKPTHVGVKIKKSEGDNILLQKFQVNWNNLNNWGFQFELSISISR